MSSKRPAEPLETQSSPKRAVVTRGRSAWQVVSEFLCLLYENRLPLLLSDNYAHRWCEFEVKLHGQGPRYITIRMANPPASYIFGQHQLGIGTQAINSSPERLILNKAMLVRTAQYHQARPVPRAATLFLSFSAVAQQLPRCIPDGVSRLIYDYACTDWVQLLQDCHDLDSEWESAPAFE